jgi:hypothetical protein
MNWRRSEVFAKTLAVDVDSIPTAGFRDACMRLD